MKKNVFIPLVLAICFFNSSCEQKQDSKEQMQKFPFTKSLWEIENKKGLQQPMDTLVYDNQRSLHLPQGHTAYLKNKKYKNFVIEFDVIGFVMPGFGFRVQDKNNYELIYIRVNSNNKKDALQYIPIYDGSLPWQLYNYPKYEAKAEFPIKKVTSLPLSYQEYFKKGIMNDTLLLKLEKKSIIFSENAEMQPINDTTWIMGDRELLMQMDLKKSSTNWEVFNQYVWTHIKVKVIGDQASIYVEDMNVPKLVVEHLKRSVKPGNISLKNQFYDAFFANVSIAELGVDESTKGIQSKNKLSSLYLSNWQLSPKFEMNEDKIGYQIDSLQAKGIIWKKIKSDIDGLVNISRFVEEMNQTVALKITLYSESKQSVKLYFDYAKHMILILNNKVIFNKKMDSTKAEGRIFVDDESVELNLSKGKNDLFLILTGDEEFKQNWGFIAKLENLNVLAIE